VNNISPSRLSRCQRYLQWYVYKSPHPYI